MRDLPYLSDGMVWYLLHVVTGRKFTAKGDVEDAREMVVENDTAHHWGRLGDHLMTHFQCDIYNFRNLQVRDPMSHRMDDNRFLCAIQRDTLYEFWSWRPGMVKNILMTLKTINEVGGEVLGLMEGLMDMEPLQLGYVIGMGVACYKFIISTRKGNYSGHLKWDSTRKPPTVWSNIYKSG